MVSEEGSQRINRFWSKNFHRLPLERHQNIIKIGTEIECENMRKSIQ